MKFQLHRNWARSESVLISILVGVAIVVGTIMRLWLLFHRPVGSDEAVVGLMAHQILHGHFTAFYWGQTYGGVEPYVVAVAFGIFGSSTWALEGTIFVLSAISALLTWRIVVRLTQDRSLSILAGVVVWAAPLTVVSNSTLADGFRAVTMVCGLVVLLFALRIFDGSQELYEFVVIGLAIGVGWWSSPEIVYFVLPAVALVAGAVFLAHTDPACIKHWALRLGVACVTTVVGMLPWLWANVGSGWQSLRVSTFGVPAHSPGYGGRLHIVFDYMLPMLLGVRKMITGQWLGDGLTSAIVISLLVLVIAIALSLCVRQGIRGWAIAGAVLTTPFLIAISPSTWFWRDGRYATFLFPLLVMALAIGATEVDRGLKIRKPTVSIGMFSAVGVSFVALCTLGFAAFMPWVDGSVGFFSSWGNPDSPTLHSIDVLETHHVDVGYADYWVSYKLDFLSNGTLKFSTAGGEPDRWVALARTVQRSRTQAWLFVPSTPMSDIQFSSNMVGPDGMLESTFISDLSRLDIPFRIVNAGLVWAVVPQRPLNPVAVGIPGST